jgi:hypothetical protein
VRYPVERFPVRVATPVVEQHEPAPVSQLWTVLLMALLGVAIGCYLNGLV